MKLIEARELTKTFGDNIVVDHVDLSVSRGEVVGFLGPNGAGKSTTMKMISGFLEPDEGSATICGFDVGTDPVRAKRHIGYLPEGAPAYSDMIVGDFLAFVGKLRGLGNDRLKIRLADMVEAINLAEVWGQQIDSLSKGYKRRVGIAQALIHDPDVLILDEPTDGLDPNQKHEMRRLIRSISANKAIVVSTHILEEVEAVCERAVIIAEGRILADAAPDTLTANATIKGAIRVTVATDNPEDAMARLKSVAGSVEIVLLEDRAGTAKLLFTPSSDVMAPAELATRIREAEIEVEQIGFHRPSLEDVFRDITGTKPPDPSDGGPAGKAEES